ncbi:uncharacterized protein LOC126265706 [Aethina tumida]|uniref:uncharacterized protein LOC126264535 n=1 Tax=Aethina tumida TaxID=116153 RepID=UPI002147DC29|nr:uncharacterized protein LOC126264535 [Aethina tumida]XP_049818890.1 uncharacterized protein LOC126264535 [Aethina tumida]XP_049819667.1 uncharacterized protein LOC126264704 [Aethina tumida]XP_049819709.1 uncharacterized protein LOC126264714 [Aethina tumida]XP_049821536.1 uncharacterized protein LOC126265076 [Aethina tumida]XP_049823968.1 uncharacterized protein LOC126265706 [Aethina tumida]
MADNSEKRDRAVSPNVVNITESVSETDNNMALLFKMQQENNNSFQKQIMEILSTMANAQTTQATLRVTAQTQPVSASVSEGVSAAAAQFRLASFDPDDTPFTMVEWMDDVTRIQQELEISDTLIVLKAGHALRGRAARFYQHWKPIIRDWASFRRDFEIAFPELGTPATRIRNCLAIKSSSFDSLVEYGNAKLTAIRRFYSDFPWNVVLSLVEYDIQNTEVKNRISLLAPTCDSELLKLLATCDANKLNAGVRERELSRKRPYSFRDQRSFQGNCRRCQRYGHKAVDCKNAEKIQNMSEKVQPGPSGVHQRNFSSGNNTSANKKFCNICGVNGHSEDTCYSKKQ